MEVVVVVSLVGHVATGVGAVEAHHVTGVVVYPDAAGKAAIAQAHLRMHIKDVAANRAEERLANEDEIVVLLIEAAGIDEHHLQETVRHIADVAGQKTLREQSHGRQRTLEHAMAGFTGLAGRIRLAVEALAEVHALQHVLVRDRHRVELRVALHVLYIGLNKRRFLLNALNGQFLSSNGFLDQGVLLWSQDGSWSILFLLCLSTRDAKRQEQSCHPKIPQVHFPAPRSNFQTGGAVGHPFMPTGTSRE